MRSFFAASQDLGISDIYRVSHSPAVGKATSHGPVPGPVSDDLGGERKQAESWLSTLPTDKDPWGGRSMPAATRLSPLDASFLAVESPSAHMHVGWAAAFRPPEGGRPSFDDLFDHIEGRLWRGRRFPPRLGGGAVGSEC